MDPELINNGIYCGKIYFQHDNAKLHVAQLWKIEKFGWDLLPRPLYSPYLETSDYYLFRLLTNDMRGRKFKDEDDLES